jgi:conjugative relaxase-like TrwC/TraI family protein
MLNVAVIDATAAAIDYYVDRQAGCASEYYTGSGEARGQWVGRGASALGLAGHIDDEVFRRLMNGVSHDGLERLAKPVLRVHPRGKLPPGPLVEAVKRLAAERAVPAADLLQRGSMQADYARAERAVGYHGSVRADVVERICRHLGLDGVALYGDGYRTALRWAGQRVDERAAGVDLCFRAPKSVAILFGLGAPDAARQVVAAHDAAVAAALGYLEQVASYGLRGHHGDGRRADRVATSGFIAAAFRHRMSRADDPLLHTHVVVANLLEGADGRWSALPSGKLFEQAKTAGYLYQRALRAELSRRLGVQWTQVVKGTAELVGVPRELIEALSKRRAQIVARIARLAQTGPKAHQAAALHDRPVKAKLAPGNQDQPGRGPAPARLQQRWIAEARRLGFDPRRLDQLGGIARAETVGLDATAVARHPSHAELTAAGQAFVARHRLDSAGIAALVRAARTPGVKAHVGGRVVGVDQLADLVRPGAEQLADELAGPRGLTFEDACFGRGDVIQGYAAGLTGPATAEDAAAEAIRHADWFLADPTRATLLHGLEPRTGERRYSTPELLAVEARLIDAAVAGVGIGRAVVAPQTLQAAIARRTAAIQEARPGFAWRAEQLAMIGHLTTSGNAVDAVVGVAGAGKTTALAVVNDAFTAAGYRVIGAALADQAVQQLAAGAGIRHCVNIARLLWELDDSSHGGFAPNTVLIVDEAGMVGTHDYDRLLAHAAAADTKVVLVGDDRQLAAIEAGGYLRGVVTRVGAAYLRENLRQQHQFDRDALILQREGNAAEAMAIWRTHGRVTVVDTGEEAKATMLARWWASPHRLSHQSVMLAYQRPDVAALNGAAHTMRVEHGEVSADGLTIAGQKFGVGDRVVALHKHGRLGEIVNGTRATITGIDSDAVTITVCTDAGAELTLPRRWLEQDWLRHAYALTGHKGQGMTILDAHVFGVSEGKLQEWGYVVMSRHQLDVQLYVVAPEWDEELDRPPRQLAYDPLAELTRSLARSAAKTLATDQQDGGDELAMRRALRTLPTHDLVRTVDTAAELLRQRPVDRTGELRALANTRALVASAYQNATAARSEGRTQSADLDRLHARLAALDARRAQLTVEQEDCARWDHDHAPQLRRAQLASQELAARHMGRLAALEHDPPAYLAAELGERPTHPVATEAWRHSVAVIERYRAADSIDDPGRAWSPEPANAHQHMVFEQAVDQVAAVQAHSEQRDLEPSDGLTLDL